MILIITGKQANVITTMKWFVLYSIILVGNIISQCKAKTIALNCNIWINKLTMIKIDSGWLIIGGFLSHWGWTF